jgi:hypothetical protein
VPACLRGEQARQPPCQHPPAPIFVDARCSHPRRVVCVPLGRRPPSATCEACCACPVGRRGRHLPIVFFQVLISLERASSCVVVNLGTAAAVVAASQGETMLDSIPFVVWTAPGSVTFFAGPLGTLRTPIPVPGESANLYSFFRSTACNVHVYFVRPA